MYEVAPGSQVVDAAVVAAGEFADLVRELVAERRQEPRDDLISDLAASDLSADEVVAAVVLLLNAGHEASVNVFGNGLVAMLSRGLRPGADLATTVEEMLRFDSALQLFERTATEDVEVAGVPVRQGQKVAALLGAANRDPQVFERADEMDVDRTPNPHIAFGAGVHFCLGAPLARMELVESLDALWAAYPSLGLVERAGEPGHLRVARLPYRHRGRRSIVDVIDVIVTKRDGGRLSPEQIDWVVDAYTRGVVADEQMSSLAMAILLNGMDREEIVRWTAAMIASGERMDFSGLSRPTSDKHSTGGVGDKITLPLAPLVAACGVAVPQLSGRGLGHTGGTLDKLESIPGWRAAISNDEMFAQLESVGAVVCAAGDGLAPADKKLYALRDVTGTVEAIPLIASSIMSKKIAEGTGSLVLDVKVGTGAFMKTVEQARELAETMVALGTDAGVHTVALLTEMSTPLGLTAGNAIEVEESVEVLAGGGPPDVVELTLALAKEMLAGAGVTDVDPADKLADGSAMDSWKAMIRAQDGDPDASLAVARESHDLVAPASGVLTRLDALAVGTAAWRLGAGRSRKEDPVQAGAGVRWHARPGDQVTEGQPLMTLLTDEPDRFERALAALEGSFDISEGGSSEAGPIVIDRVGA